MVLTQRKPVVTLVGLRQAKEGFAFIHQRPSQQCKDCKYYQICIKNLEAERVYQVVGLRERIFPCKFHDEGVRVVEVVESDILATLPSKLAIEGAVTTFQTQECNVQACEHYELCFPHGLVEGDRCAVLEIGKNIMCPQSLFLVKVVLRRLSSS